MHSLRVLLDRFRGPRRDGGREMTAYAAAPPSSPKKKTKSRGRRSPPQSTLEGSYYGQYRDEEDASMSAATSFSSSNDRPRSSLNLIRQTDDGYSMESYEVGLSSSLDPKRSNQDRIVCTKIDPERQMFLVIDGHGGVECVDFVSSAIPRSVVEAIVEKHAPQEVALMESFLKTSQAYDWATPMTPECARAGAVALALIVSENDRCVLANAGDCRCVYSLANGGIAQVNSEHRVSNAQERARVEALGGTISNVRGTYRVSGTLMPSRTFGDVRVRTSDDGVVGNFIDPIPDVVEFRPERNADGVAFVVIGSDGLWDGFSNEEACTRMTKLVNEGESAQSIAKQLCLVAMRRTLDDVSCVVLIWR